VVFFTIRKLIEFGDTQTAIINFRYKDIYRIMGNTMFYPTPLRIDCNYTKDVALLSIVDRKAGQHLCSLSTCDAFLFLKFAYRISAGSSEVSPVIYT